MRRSLPPLTVWPAFADLMTIIAVVSLAIAGGLAMVDPRGEPDPTLGLEAQISDLEAQINQLKLKLEDSESENASLRNQIRFGGDPCLDTQPDSPPAPLLRIVANSGYVLTRLWRPEDEDDVKGIPELSDAIARGPMSVDEFTRHAAAIYGYGISDDTFDGRPCRFFVELKNETDSPVAFMNAVGLVGGHFLFSNSSEVNEIMRSAE